MNAHIGGRLAANFRSANIAEGLSIQMLRPFAAVAPVPREEDYGLDLIATLLRRSGKVLVAENSFAIQVKTHTAAKFSFAGDGIKWLRELDLPYFPLVANLTTATASLYTINSYRAAILPNMRLEQIDFVPEGDGLHDFPLGDPLMTWTLAEAASPGFDAWAYSVLKPAVLVEAWNQQFAPAQLYRELEYETQTFAGWTEKGGDARLPAPGRLRHIPPPGNNAFVRDTLTSILGPFATWLANSDVHEHSGTELLTIRDSLRRLGIDPDPAGAWDEIVVDMANHAQASARG